MERKVRLPDGGRTVAVACRAAARGIDMVMDAARHAATGEVGSVHIGASPTAASHYIDGPLAAFVARRPRILLQVTVASTKRVCEEVELGVLDVGCVEDPLPVPAPRSMSSVKLADDEVLLVARPDHPLVGGGPLEPPDLAGHQFLARAEGPALDAVARQMLGSAVEVVAW